MAVTNVLNSNKTACYWQLSVPDNTWRLGSQIVISTVSMQNVSAFMFGGNSRSNASIAVTLYNATLY